MIKKVFICSIAAGLLLSGCTGNGGTGTSESTVTTTEADTTAETQAESATEPVVEPVLGIPEGLSTSSVTWGAGKTVDHQRPTDPVQLQAEYEKYGASWLLEDKEEILLTFDEGYENGYTPAILDTLREKGVSAVFFVTYDFAQANPALIQRMIDEGHVVGNHTYRHKTMHEISLETAQEEIQVLHDYILENFQYEMNYFRFPKGEFSESTLALAQSMGYESMFWSFAYADWDADNAPGQEEAFEKITASTHNGAIFLLHAVSATNAEILGDVIDDVRDQGYEFASLA